MGQTWRNQGQSLGSATAASLPSCPQPPVAIINGHGLGARVNEIKLFIKRVEVPEFARGDRFEHPILGPRPLQEYLAQFLQRIADVPWVPGRCAPIGDVSNQPEALFCLFDVAQAN